MGPRRENAMPVTEIYSCKDGQKLKEGRLDLSHDIETKEQAEADARRRCKLDPSIRRVAYYAVSDDGRFRNFFTHTNANAAPAPRKAMAGEPPRRRPARRKPAPKKGWLQKLKEAIGLG